VYLVTISSLVPWKYLAIDLMLPNESARVFLVSLSLAISPSIHPSLLCLCVRVFVQKPNRNELDSVPSRVVLPLSPASATH